MVAIALESESPRRSPFALAVFLLFGLYLTCHGYHSRDGDQAYRLPLLLDRQDPAPYAADPFVRAFDAFNPHRGYLILLDLASRPAGLSAAIFALYALTFAITCIGLDRLARGLWSADPARVGLATIALVLVAKAGNIGTNHLFEPLLLDRLIGFALAWLGLSFLVRDAAPIRTAICLGLVAWLHPSLGLQLGALAGVSWLVLAILPGAARIPWRRALAGPLALGLAFVPALLLQGGQSARFFEGLPIADLVLLEAYIQSPQHMIPHLWRLPQWAAFACYPALAVLTLVQAPRPWSTGLRRLATIFGLTLLGLVVAYIGVEVVGDPRIIVFQPFRMATIARGLALVILAGRLAALWRQGDLLGRARAGLIVAGLLGDRALVVATLTELAATGAEWAFAARLRTRWAVFGATLGGGLFHLARHDTESGHWPLLAGLGLGVAAGIWGRRQSPGWRWTPRRVRWAVAICWAVPIAAGIAPGLPLVPPTWTQRLLDRCRFGETPSDDLERLALWCRGHSPVTARFIGPPQPKTFRLWARRSLAFNRSGSPYHAAGIADWAERFRDHVGFAGTNAEFAAAYLKNRQELERGFDRLAPAELVALAERQGADHILARPGLAADRLELLRVEGRYAIYRVRPAPAPGPRPAQATASTARSAGTG